MTMASQQSATSRSIERATAIGWEGNVFGYAASDFRPGGEGERGWRRIRPDAALPQPLGVRMLGTGTVLARGDAIPAISGMAPYLGHADVGFALLNHRAGRRAWALLLLEDVADAVHSPTDEFRDLLAQLIHDAFALLS